MAGANARRMAREVRELQTKLLRERLAELRQLITVAREAKRAALKAVQTDCAARRLALREQCQARAIDAKQKGSSDVAAKRGVLKEERELHRRVERASGPARARSSARERRQESDDAVRSNIAPEMVPVFNAVRKHIKGGPRKTRTEHFLEWAHENPDEVWPILNHQTERDLAHLIAEHEQTERAYHRAKAGRSAVPF